MTLTVLWLTLFGKVVEYKQFVRLIQIFRLWIVLRLADGRPLLHLLPSRSLEEILKLVIRGTVDNRKNQKAIKWKKNQPQILCIKR